VALSPLTLHAQSFLDQARTLVHARTSADQAKSLLQQAIAADNYLPGCFGVGRSDLLSGQNFDEAERYFKKYLTRWPEETDPTWANTYWRLGQLYEKEGKKDLAIAEWQEALKLNPNYKPAQDSLKAAGR
jgi:tetratricopeptide (TPR) repeat protein